MKTFKQIIAEVEEPKSADEKRFKDKHVIQKTDDVAGNDDAVYKGSKVKKDKSKISGHEDGQDKEVYEEVEEDDMTEGRRPKAKDGEEEGGEHIAMQLRKSISMRGQKAVKFNDGKEVKVSMRDADKFFRKFNKLRMAKDKIKMTRDAAKSHSHFKKIIDEDSEVKELSTKTLGSYISKASDASKHRGLPTRKVDNRYSGVARASKKLDQRESVEEGVTGAVAGGVAGGLAGGPAGAAAGAYLGHKIQQGANRAKPASGKTVQSKPSTSHPGVPKPQKPVKSEGMMKNIAIDLKDLDAAEFQRKYNMSKADAMKKHGKPEDIKKLASADKAKYKKDNIKNTPTVNEVRIPPFKEVMKVIGHTKNAVEGRAALKKKYGVSDKQADEIIKKTFNLNEKTLTPAEKKKREEIAQAIQRDNPDMPMDKKMAIATATAKKVAEDDDLKDVAKKLKGASKTHSKQADVIMKHIKDMGEEVLYEADAIETLQKAAKSSRPMRIKFDSGTSENLDKQTAEQLLDVHKKLNSNNKKRFEQKLFKSSIDFMKMVDFAVKKAG